MIVTAVPPLAGPFLTDSFLISGGMPVLTYVNWLARPGVVSPNGVLTVIATVPVPGGATAVMVVGEMTPKPSAGVAPNLTSVACSSCVPVIVTTEPPSSGPSSGSIEVSAGGLP